MVISTSGHGNVSCPEYPFGEKGVGMDKENVNITEKTIGDTIYIVESVYSGKGRETAYDKVKKLILNELKTMPLNKAS